MTPSGLHGRESIPLVCDLCFHGPCVSILRFYLLKYANQRPPIAQREISDANSHGETDLGSALFCTSYSMTQTNHRAMAARHEGVVVS